MENTKCLRLYEQMMLLSLRDEKGTVESGALFQYAIGGAIMAELLVRHRIKADGPQDNQLVSVINFEPVNDPLLDEWLGHINGSEHQSSLQDWITKIIKTEDLKHRVAIGLCQKDILRADEGKVLHIFKREVFPERNHEPESKIIARLKDAIFTDTSDVDPMTVVLISLAKSTHILPAIFDKKELKQRKERIEQLIKGEITGQATEHAIEAMQNALLIASMTPIFLSDTTDAD
jgi:hypothetical protein